MEKIEGVLIKITEALNSTDILWGVGASMLLYQYKLVDNPSDIDITVSISDIKEVDRILSSMGEKLSESKSDIYLTEYFYEYIIDGVNIDVMAGFKINLTNSVFEYPFDKNSVPHHLKVGNTPIPFSSLEDWFVLYQLMPKREYKVNLIDEYFKNKGIEYPVLLERIVQIPNLPEKVKKKILEINN